MFLIVYFFERKISMQDKELMLILLRIMYQEEVISEEVFQIAVNKINASK